MRIGLIDVDGHNKKTRWGVGFSEPRLDENIGLA